MQLHVKIFQDDDKSFVARVEEYPELLATGFTFDELREAVEEQVSLFSGTPSRITPESFSELSADATLVSA